MEGDAHRLSQLLGNLLSNACKYTPAGGHISVTTRAGGIYAEVAVKDNGCGIEPAALEQIFEMFGQRSPVIERIGGGLGIGLALSRRIAELHTGALVAESDGPSKAACLLSHAARDAGQCCYAKRRLAARAAAR